MGMIQGAVLGAAGAISAATTNIENAQEVSLQKKLRTVRNKMEQETLTNRQIENEAQQQKLDTDITNLHQQGVSKQQDIFNLEGEKPKKGRSKATIAAELGQARMDYQKMMDAKENAEYQMMLSQHQGWEIKDRLKLAEAEGDLLGVSRKQRELGKHKLDLQMFAMKPAMFDFDKNKDVTFDGKEASDLKPVSYNFDRDETGDEQEAREAYERDRKLPPALFDFDKDQPVLDDEGYQKSTFKPGETKVGNGYKLDLQMFANKEDYDRIKAYLKGLKGFDNLDSATKQAIIRAKGWEYDRLNELRDQYPIEGINSIEDQYEDMKKRNMNISDYGLYVKSRGKKGDK